MISGSGSITGCNCGIGTSTFGLEPISERDPTEDGYELDNGSLIPVFAFDFCANLEVLFRDKLVARHDLGVYFPGGFHACTIGVYPFEVEVKSGASAAPASESTSATVSPARL